MAAYKQYKLNGKVLTDCIQRTSDGACIQKGDESHYGWIEYQKWLDEGNTAEEADNKLTWDDIRSTRDQILRDTDWTMTTGATVDQAQWAAYRQNLRDIPQTYKDKTPDDVVWPTQPSTKGPNS